MTAVSAIDAAAAALRAAHQLTAALADIGVDVAVDLRKSGPWSVLPRLDVPGAERLVHALTALCGDVVDRVEVAVVVEHLVELHADHADGGCVVCGGDARCVTRQLLAGLPGGAP